MFYNLSLKIQNCFKKQMLKKLHLCYNCLKLLAKFLNFPKSSNLKIDTEILFYLF